MTFREKGTTIFLFRAFFLFLYSFLLLDYEVHFIEYQETKNTSHLSIFIYSL